MKTKDYIAKIREYDPEAVFSYIPCRDNAYTYPLPCFTVGLSPGVVIPNNVFDTPLDDLDEYMKEIS